MARVTRTLALAVTAFGLAMGLSLATTATAQADDPFARWVQLADSAEEIQRIADDYEIERDVDCFISDLTYAVVPPLPEWGAPGYDYWSATITCYQ